MAAIERKLRWFYPTPGKSAIMLLVVEGILFLFEGRFPKGYAMLIALASVVAMMLLMLFWFIASLFFHWRFQFSIRSLLMLTAVFAIPFSWLAVAMKQAREQKLIIKAIENWEGKAYLDYQYAPSGIQFLVNQSPCPEWLRTLLGEELFEDVTFVNLGVWQSISEFPTHKLELTNDDYFRAENLFSGKITADAKGDRLSFTQPVDFSNAVINLHDLGLNEPQITDDRQEYIVFFPYLLKRLKDLPHLRKLGFWRSRITDDELQPISGLTQIRELDLGETGITDAGLEHIKEMTQLQELNLQGTKVTYMGIKKLRQALPNCKISYSFLFIDDGE